jgi:26S proteasome regulatory subunit N10
MKYSHQIDVPTGSYILSDFLVSTPLIGGDAAAFADGGQFEFGVDPNVDPELAEAIRQSLQEQQQQQQQQQQPQPQPQQTKETKGLRLSSNE